MTETVDYFDIRKTYECFNSSLLEDEDINIGFYLEAYKELCKFCGFLGPVFSFVKNEIVSKSEIMHQLRNNCQEDHFETLKNMIEYEHESQLLHKKNYVSGCRTFLRLHRGLDFIRTFLRRIGDTDLDSETSAIGYDSYSNTLGKYHGWCIQQAAYVGMKFLPKKKNLVSKVCGSNWEDVASVLPLMLNAADEVYKRTEECYKTHGLLDLP